MNEYRYSLRDGKMNRSFDSEEELKQEHPFDVCEANEHDWHTTFAFGIYYCSKCKARKKVGRKDTWKIR